MNTAIRHILLGATLAASLMFIPATALALGAPPSATPDGGQHASSAPASQDSPAPPEQYIALLKGSPRIDAASVSATYSNCFFCATTTASQTVSFGQSDFAALRWAGWGKHFGFAAEWSVYHGNNTRTPNIPQASFSYQALSMILMLRAPILSSETLPNGRLNFYGGFGLDRIMTGNMDVSIPPNAPFSTGVKPAIGTTFLIGASLNFRKVLFLLEFRQSSATLESQNWAPGNSATIPVDANSTVFGIAYRF